jgi:hypothetical protein
MMSMMTAWPLTIEISGQPPGVNQRLHWQARRRLCRPFVDAVGWQAKAFGLEQPLERARVVVTLLRWTYANSWAKNAQCA